MNKLSKNNFILIEITGDSCANCLTLAREINNIKNNFQSVEFKQLRAEDLKNNDIIQQYNVEKVPCLLFFNHDKLLGKCYGYQPTEILQIWIEGKIEEETKKNEENSI